MLISRNLGVGLVGLTLCACSVLPITPPATPPAAMAQATARTTMVTATQAPALAPRIIIGPPTPTELGPAVTPNYVPVTWSNLGLTGTLVFITGTGSLESDRGLVPNLVSLNLATGGLQTLFVTPPQAVLATASMSPDGKYIALAYAPPSTTGHTQFGFVGLYLLPGNGLGNPQPVLDRTADKHAFFQPTWSPDSQFVYYTHYDPHLDSTANYAPTYDIERWNVNQGATEVIVRNAYWPRLSRDGTRLVYVTVDATNTHNELFIAKADGQSPARLDLPDNLIVDAPLFSSDGQWVYFSAASLTMPAAHWLDRLLGVQTAEVAPNLHSIPSDWWRVPVTGGEPEQITALYDIALFGAFSSDGRFLAFVNASGVFVMDPLGQAVTTLLLDTRLVGTLDWLP